MPFISSIYTNRFKFVSELLFNNTLYTIIQNSNISDRSCSSKYSNYYTEMSEKKNILELFNIFFSNDIFVFATFKFDWVTSFDYKFLSNRNEIYSTTSWLVYIYFDSLTTSLRSTTISASATENRSPALERSFLDNTFVKSSCILAFSDLLPHNGHHINVSN